MQKAFYIIAHNGAEIIDDTPEAEIRLANMEETEQLYNRRMSRKRAENSSLRKMVHKVACACGIL